MPGDRANHIFTLHVDATGMQELITADANDTEPSRSPDGRMITFARDKTHVWGGLAANWDNGSVICVVNSDGTNERQLMSDNVFAYSPQFSSDGERVLGSYSSDPETFNAESPRLRV